MSDDAYALTDVLNAYSEEIKNAIYCALPGVVVSYNATKQTATIHPACEIPHVLSGKYAGSEDGIGYSRLPDLPDVPVSWPSGGGYVASFPLGAGDPVMLVFSDVALGEYLATGSVSQPKDVRKHSIGYPMCIPGGFRPDTKAVADASATEVVIGKDGSDQQIRVNATNIVLGKGATDAVALASKVLAELQAFRTAFNAHQHLETGGTTNAPTVPMSAPGSVASTLIKAK